MLKFQGTFLFLVMRDRTAILNALYFESASFPFSRLLPFRSRNSFSACLDSIYTFVYFQTSSFNVLHFEVYAECFVSLVYACGFHVETFCNVGWLPFWIVMIHCWWFDYGRIHPCYYLLTLPRWNFTGSQ